MSRLLQGWLLGAGALCAVALSSPAVALAGPPAEFTARASNGYTIHVRGGAGRVALSASGRLGGARYIVPGRLSRHGIAARFGSRGRVDVEFKPGKRMRIETPPNGCQGKPRVRRWGVFVGTVRFAGERGYTRLHRGRVAGRTQSSPRWRCRGRRGRDGVARLPFSAEEPEEPIVWEVFNRRLGLEVGVVNSSLFGSANSNAVIATMSERRPRMRIERQFFDLGVRQTAFSFDEELTTATISPPAPFSGKGVFERVPGSGIRWTGDLAVQLPGTARIPLVGKRYHPRLYRLDEDGIAKPGI